MAHSAQPHGRLSGFPNMPRILDDSTPVLCIHFSTRGVAGISSSFRSELKCQLRGAALSGLVTDVLDVLPPFLHFVYLRTLSSTVSSHWAILPVCACLLILLLEGNYVGWGAVRQITKIGKARARQPHTLLLFRGHVTPLYLGFCICNMGIIYLVPTSSCYENHNKI